MSNTHQLLTDLFHKALLGLPERQMQTWLCYAYGHLSNGNIEMAYMMLNRKLDRMLAQSIRQYHEDEANADML